MTLKFSSRSSGLLVHSGQGLGLLAQSNILRCKSIDTSRSYLMRVIPLAILFLALSYILSAQQPLQFDLKEAPDSAYIQLTPELQFPTEEAGYTLLLPQDTVKGMIVLFHSGRDTTQAGYEMRLYAAANEQQVATLYVTTGNRLEFLFEEKRYEQLDRYIGTVLEAHPIPKDRLLFAGMSLAGTRALKFAHWCQAGNSRYGIKPRAVALCDAPLFFHRFWWEGEFSIQHNTHPITVNEATWVNAQLEKHLGGTPMEVPDAYRNYSPYNKGMELDEQLKGLEGVAVRAYTEPDVHWWLDNRNRGYYGMNAVDAAELVRDLHLLGNEEAELITTTGKGYRPDGSRHPHSWSIVDNGELVAWLLGL